MHARSNSTLKAWTWLAEFMASHVNLRNIETHGQKENINKLSVKHANCCTIITVHGK